MASRVWQAVGVVAVLGLGGCASGNATLPTLPSSSSSSSASGPEALVGPDWTLESIGGKPVVDGTTLTAAFSADGRVSGSAGCNRYFGSARPGTGTLSVGPLGSTMMACEQRVMDQEMLYLASLQAATSFTIQGRELRLGPSASQATLVFASR
jgi:heat shock protein HslJ